MPGYSLRFDFDGGSSSPGPEFRSVLDSLRHLDGYSAQVAFDDGPVALGHSAYRSYPLDRYRYGSVTLFLEGRIYGVPDVGRALESLAGDLFEPGRDTDAVAEWVAGTDGEFVVVAVHDSGEVAVLNDALARLPLYYHRTAERLVLSRESEFVLEHCRPVRFDRHAVAQYLLFGYPLGDRTLWSGVRRVPPGTLVRARADGTVAVEDLHTWNFEDPAHADRSVEDNAGHLVELFEDACRSRFDVGDPTVISLSGGNDSRAVAAAADRFSLPAVAATFQRGDGESADATVARAVARALDLEWDLVRLSEFDPERVYRLLRLKNGLNPVGMEFILEFFETLRERYGRDMTYVTGDGGDKTLPDLSPATSLSSVEELVSHVVDVEGVYPVEEVAELTGISETGIVDSVREVIEGYPETDPEAGYVHFLVHERGMNWLTEGEDRNRAYFWSVSPFYSLPFFAYAMGVPADQKSRNRLYRTFFDRLWPQALEFDDANFGTPMGSPRYRLVMAGLEFLERHPRLLDAAGTVYRGEVGYEYPRPIHETMTSQVRRCDEVTDYLDPGALDRILADRGACDSKQIDRLFSVTSAIDKVACDNGVPDPENERADARR